MNRHTQVKICGIKEEDTLRQMAGLSVHYIGFLFATSKRQVTPERAAKLLASAREIPMADGKAPLAVGVFVNPMLDELKETLDQVHLDVIQLHGGESPDFCRAVREQFGLEVWRSLSVAEEGATEEGAGPNRLEAYAGSVDAILLDTAEGGTGRVFRWDLIPTYQAAAQRLGLKLIVAGGLTPGNVGELLEGCRPDAVDISSGVETDGVKDANKIAAFAEKVERS